MKVLIFGGRNFYDQSLMQKTLDAFYLQNGAITCVIHGNAPGADSMGRMFARNWLGVPDEPYPADWKDLDAPGAVIKHGKYGPYNAVAGHQRNQRMIDEGKPAWGIMFPGGTGTADMNARLVKAGIPVWDASK